MSTHLDVTAANGTPFRVVFYRDTDDGRRTGPLPAAFRDGPLTGRTGSMVEFYDKRYDFTKHGQFVSRYLTETLLDRPTGGLNLDGGVPSWSIDAATMAVVYAWVAAQSAYPGLTRR